MAETSAEYKAALKGLILDAQRAKVEAERKKKALDDELLDLGYKKSQAAAERRGRAFDNMKPSTGKAVVRELPLHPRDGSAMVLPSPMPASRSQPVVLAPTVVESTMPASISQPVITPPGSARRAAMAVDTATAAWTSQPVVLAPTVVESTMAAPISQPAITPPGPSRRAPMVVETTMAAPTSKPVVFGPTVVESTMAAPRSSLQLMPAVPAGFQSIAPAPTMTSSAVAGLVPQIGDCVRVLAREQFPGEAGDLGVVISRTDGSDGIPRIEIAMVATGKVFSMELCKSDLVEVLAQAPRVQDCVEALPGVSLTGNSGGVEAHEIFKAGDIGVVSAWNFEEVQPRVLIQWQRTGKATCISLDKWPKWIKVVSEMPGQLQDALPAAVETTMAPPQVEPAATVQTVVESIAPAPMITFTAEAPEAVVVSDLVADIRAGPAVLATASTAPARDIKLTQATIRGIFPQGTVDRIYVDPFQNSDGTPRQVVEAMDQLSPLTGVTAVTPAVMGSSRAAPSRDSEVTDHLSAPTAAGAVISDAPQRTSQIHSGFIPEALSQPCFSFFREGEYLPDAVIPDALGISPAVPRQVLEVTRQLSHPTSVAAVIPGALPRVQAAVIPEATLQPGFSFPHAGGYLPNATVIPDVLGTSPATPSRVSEATDGLAAVAAVIPDVLRRTQSAVMPEAASQPAFSFPCAGERLPHAVMPDALVSGRSRDVHQPFDEWALVMLQPVCEEHSQEIASMWDENVQLRRELARVSQLMQSFLDREAAMVRTLEEIRDGQAVLLNSHGSSMQQSADFTSAHVQGWKYGRSQIIDPITTTEAELARIAGMLATPAVPPPTSPPSSPGASAFSPLPSAVLPAAAQHFYC